MHDIINASLNISIQKYNQSMSYIMSTFLKFCFVLLKKISFLGQVLLRIEDIALTIFATLILRTSKATSHLKT